MILKAEQIERDNERWKDRDLKTELRYCGLNYTDRIHITNDELRFYAWLFRTALKTIEDMEAGRSTELPRKYRAKELKSGRYLEGYYFQYPSTSVCFDNDAHLVETIHGLVTYRTTDWGLPNVPQFAKIDPNTLEVVENG